MADGEDPHEDRRRRRKARKAARQQAVAVMPMPGGRPDPALWLGDLDAWNLRIEGDWLRFDARLDRTGPRGFMRPLAGGDILADAPGPLLAILGLGGPRAAGFVRGAARFAHHVLAPADHVGAVGTEGTAVATRTAGLSHIPHRTREALCADTLLDWRQTAWRGLPLILVRAETDGAASPAALARGQAFANFTTALDNLGDAAATLGRRAQVLAVTLTFGGEDLASGSPAGFAAGYRALMAAAAAAIQARGLVPPVFLALADCGTAEIAEPVAARAWAELALCPGDRRLILTAPSYAIAQDGFGRPTAAGLCDIAALDAHALEAVAGGGGWFCPQPLIAEHDGPHLRVTFRAMGPLVIDAGDPFAAGPAAGFRIAGGGVPVAITGARVAPDDPQALILTCDRAPQGGELLHACGLADTGDGRPINRSAVRDDWQAAGADGPLHRWALPAALPIHPGAGS